MINAPLSPSLRRCLQRLSCAFLLVATLGAAQQAAAQSERNSKWATLINKASNLYRVTPTFYRSAQLTRKDVAVLQSLGVKTVVGLRAFHSDAELLKAAGIKPIRVRIYTWDIDDKQVVDALRAIRAAEREGPVLLHCQHGADRTGLIAAMYRILYQNWTREEALDELTHGGYGYHALWKNIPRYLRKVDIEKIRQRVEQQ